ncbi:MAG: 50S ribosomal protein L15 [Actinomycetota bacterium]
MKLHDLKPAEGGKTKGKRVGRGRASGHGKTSTRGQKGQHARNTTRPGFEGGQMPLIRRVPKLAGFKNPDKLYYELVNVGRLNDFKASETVDPTALTGKGLIKKATLKVKILGDGEVSKALTVKAHAFSKAAKEKIEAAGGRAEVL